MLGGGVLTDVCAAVMVHVIPALPLPAGRVLLPAAGVGAPAAVFFRIDLTGDAGHVGEKRGEDAGERAVRLYQRMQGAARSIGRGLSLSIGVLRAGDAPNVLPASATLSGSFRAKDETAVKRFRKLLSRLTAETREARLTFLGDCPPLYNDGRVVSLLASFLPTLGHPCLTPEGRGGSAAEDFAHFAARVPAVCLGLSAGEAGRGYDHPLHQPSVLFDEDALPTGAALYAASAMILGEHLHTFTNPADA
jgi:amidohydrolase